MNDPDSSQTDVQSAVLSSYRKWGRVYAEPSIDRRHIFHSLLERLSFAQPATVRLALIHEYVMIEAIVSAVRAGGEAEVLRAIENIKLFRSQRLLDNAIAGNLDALLLPALALHDLERGRCLETLDKLGRSVVELEMYWASGIEEAGAAILEQRLNVLRAFSRFGDLANLADRGALFVLGLLGVEGEGIEVTPNMAGNIGGDNLQVIYYYISKAIEKALSNKEAFEELVSSLVSRVGGAPTDACRVLIELLEPIIDSQATTMKPCASWSAGNMNSSIPPSIVVLIEALAREGKDGSRRISSRHPKRQNYQ